MNITNWITKKILGGSENFSFEERLVLSSALYICVICFTSTFFNLELRLGVETVTLVFVSFIFNTVLYVLGRFYKKTVLTKWLFNIYTFLFCDFYWFFNYGSTGSALFMFLIYSTILVYLWNDKHVKIVAAALFLNIIALFILEQNYPNIVAKYPTEEARVSDSYVGLMVVLGYCILVGINAKKNYIKQYEKAQHSDKLKTAFLANISHEIRTPLNAILGFSHLLTYQDMEPFRKEKYSQLIHENGNYLTKLVSDILDVSLLESGQLKTNKNRFELNNLISKIYSNFEHELKSVNKERIQLLVETPAKSVELNQDEFRLEQILSNLLSNSVKFTSHGYIKFGYIVENKNVIFFVEDTGRGIKEENQKAIFDRFVKFDDGIDFKFVRGAGVGLSLAKELTVMLGGTISFKSTYLSGSTFYLSIPFE